MLQLKNIVKEYEMGDSRQTALKDVSVSFRENEFVSILGPSGSGKTTLLNIIGGLDHYTSGDLIINGVSTKKYKDSDWDSYRNHSIGFVFQSYNLIPHQTVLSNVELALTLAGVSPKERRQRATAVLERVGLKEHIYKKPNQMSGGQMQRVAIARALINDPDILLADEPTGALDSETSVQIMELLKEIAKDKLVVMVTHNPELAEKYSTRIINLLDGVITSDTEPFEPVYANKAVDNKTQKVSMSFLTALSLSFNNLRTKKGRTLLTSFAGSIGIIGIALILALSTGVNNYIAGIQEETLSSYPLAITDTSADFTSAIASVETAKDSGAEGENVQELKVASDMFSRFGTNDLKAFKKYMQQNEDEITPYINAVKYDYGIMPQIYKSDVLDKVTQLNPNTMISAYSNSTAMYSSYMSNSSYFQEMMDNREFLESQYDVLKGRWPESYDEAVLVLNEPNTISDMLTYSLGLRDPDVLSDMVTDIMNGKTVKDTSAPLNFTYDDLLNLKFKLVSSSDYYRYNSQYDVWEDMTDDEAYMAELVRNGEDIKIVGIICAKDGVSATSLMAGVAYTHELTEHIIQKAAESDIVKAQKKSPEKDVFSGKNFDELESDNSSEVSFGDMLEIDSDKLSSAFSMNIDEKGLQNTMQSYILSMTSSISTDTAAAQAGFTNGYKALFKGLVTANADSSGYARFETADFYSKISGYMASDAAKTVLNGLSSKYGIPSDSFGQAYTGLISSVMSSALAASEPLYLNEEAAETMAEASLENAVVQQTVASMGKAMAETSMKISVSQKAAEMAQQLMSGMAGGMNVDTNAFAEAFSFNMDEKEFSRLLQTMMTSSSKDKTAESNLQSLDYAEEDNPTGISVYLKDFESKNAFKDFISRYNTEMEQAGDEEKVINYTDITGILMSSVVSIVDTVSYVLIAFVSVSLVVSSIMIGIITYISVLERTKEIGILRAIGASKKDVSRVFNAETVIIGFVAGLIGVIASALLTIPANVIIKNLTGVSNVAQLPFNAAVILVLLSMTLTTVAGLIPSGMASKKDPVVALRTE